MQYYKTIDICSGIGGIRKAFEMAGKYKNVLSAEIDKFACITYEHLYKENPHNDLTSDSFKLKVESIKYDILLAGFPCQSFSRAGLQEGFNDNERGIIFSHIADIIRRTRPKVIFLENVDNLITHNKGQTLKHILDTLEFDLRYKVIGTDIDNNKLTYSSKSFIRNSKNFGVPQNRPRTYIIGFNRDIYGMKVNELPNQLPERNSKLLYNNLNYLLEQNVNSKYYLSAGYLETLENHKKRQKAKGNGFGYKIVNSSEISNPIANTLLARGGSGKERNLILQPNSKIVGKQVKYKKTPINSKGVRVMTPTEWGKLQGFINYAFLDENGEDTFSFPEGISDTQKYKQFGNSVTIPVIEEMAKFITKCLEELEKSNF